MKIAICDDEKISRNEIARLIKNHQPKADVVSFASCEEMLAEQGEFSIYLLDIEMQGLSGMEAAREIRQKEDGKNRYVIIFITGYREYMEEAFDVHAYHYLVKPMNEAKFFEVFDRAWNEAKVLEEIWKKKIFVKTAGTSRCVYVKDIYYIESNNKKVSFHTVHGNFDVYSKMECLEAELSGTFYRCHRCYLVNLANISAYNADTIQLINGETVLLAKKKYSEFVKTFLRYAKGGGIVNV